MLEVLNVDNAVTILPLPCAACGCTVVLQFDEEEYDSVDGDMLTPNGDVLATLLRKSLEARVQFRAAEQPMASTQPSSAVPQQNELPDEHLNDGYNSDEYESIKENVSVL
jgi:hypothetical protein